MDIRYDTSVYLDAGIKVIQQIYLVLHVNKKKLR